MERRHRDGAAMRTDKFNKSDVVARLKENRAKHESEYNEAVEGYRASALKEVQQGIEKLRMVAEQIERGEEFNLDPIYFQSRVPESHLDDYDQMIDLFELQTQEEVNLDTSEFSRYMRDNWEWAREFKAISATYKAFK